MKQFLERRYVLPSLSGIAILLSVIAIILSQASTSIETPPNQADRLAACRGEALKLVTSKPIDIAALKAASDFCYNRVRGEDLLGDFSIRRTNYLRQQYQGLVFLWMVVAITLSGVVLSGIQLLAAYKLAATGRAKFEQGGDVSIEEKRLSVKSSVTGVLILTVSFAFFMVFVIWVYPLTSPDGGEQAAGSNGGATRHFTLLPGGVGPPPGKSKATPPPPAPK